MISDNELARRLSAAWNLICLGAAIGAVIIVVGVRAARAEGWRCSHSSECPEHQLCVADGPQSDLGVCTRIRILP